MARELRAIVTRSACVVAHEMVPAYYRIATSAVTLRRIAALSARRAMVPRPLGGPMSSEDAQQLSPRA